MLDQHLRGELSIGQVTAALKCTPRHVYRLKKSYREQGVEAIIHGNRGNKNAAHASRWWEALIRKSAQTT